MNAAELTPIVLGGVTGMALSAAAGFRIFVPLLVAGCAAHLGYVQLAPDFAWLASWPALAVFAAATLTEVLAYYFPAVDHFLDVIGAPAAVVAGSILSASMIFEVDPWLRWPMAIIAGGGAAGGLHAGKAIARGMSTVSTAGLANPILSTGELLASLTVAGTALVVPVLVLVVLLVAGMVLLVWLVRRWRLKARRRAASSSSPG
jgi:hypothetical protein